MACRAWFAARERYDYATEPADRVAAREALATASQGLDHAWAAAGGDALFAQPERLRAALAGAFEYAPWDGASRLETVVLDEMRVRVQVPLGYDATRATPTVVVLSDANPAGGMVDIADHLAAAWKGTPFVDTALFVSPEIGGNPLDTTRPGPTNPNLRVVLGTVGAVQRRFHVDRERVILDCGRGACGFGLQLAAMFPDRFAGVILRHPTAPGVPLDSLGGTRVLVIANGDTEAAARAIDDELNALAPGTCTVRRSDADSPHGGMAIEIAAWSESVRRELYRKNLIVAPPEPLFGRSHWLDARSADRHSGTRVEARIDREHNRITLQTAHVDKLKLLLDGAMLDLGREIEVRANGKTSRHRLTPDRDAMLQRTYNRFDPGWVFAAELELELAR